MEAARSSARDERQKGAFWHPEQACQDQWETEHGRCPMRHAAGSKFPCGHLKLAAHRARITSRHMMKVMRFDRLSPPSEVRQAKLDRPKPAGPRRTCGFV